MFYHFRSVIILHFRSLRFSYLSYSKENCFAIFHNDELEYVFEQKDLGIILDVDLKCDEYISTNVVVRFIRWSLWYLDGPLFQKLSTAFVRPHLGYGRLIWASYLKKTIHTLEIVQRRATKFVNGHEFWTMQKDKKVRYSITN